MPHPALHVFLAAEALDRWRSDPGCAPFPVGAPGVENHLLHGALAPDMGFFPGCDRHFSERLHAGGASGMARRLLAGSASPTDSAFAWGWITHVLADVEIHPLINTCAREVLHAEGHPLPTREAHRQAHVRVEAGIDAWVFAAEARLRRMRLAPAFDARRIDLLGRAFHSLYDISISHRRLFAFHRNVTIFYNAYRHLAAVIAAEFKVGGRTSIRLSHVRAVGMRLLDRRSTAFGFLEPVPPTEALLAAVRTATSQFHARLDLLAAVGVDDLVEYDLETGQVAQTPRDAQRAMAAASGRVPPPLPAPRPHPPESSRADRAAALP